MTEQTQGAAGDDGVQANHITTVRRHLLEQMRALRSASGDQIKTELERSKGLSDLAQVMVNTAKVEVDYLRATGQQSTPFLEVPPDRPYLTDGETGDHAPGSTHTKRQLPPPGNGITAITRHTLKG